MKSGAPSRSRSSGLIDKLHGYPGVFGDISFTPECHDGYPDEGIVMVEANSLKNGAFKLAPIYNV